MLYGLVGSLDGWLVYSSSCSHFKHRAAKKCFVSLQFLNLRHSVGLLRRVISPSQGRYLAQTYIHASSVIRTHDSSERVKTVDALDRAATVINVIYKEKY
jgi:hypothetical protein